MSRYHNRVIGRLYEALRREAVLYEKDAYELAIRMVRRVSEGNTDDPFFYAHCWYYGVTPENMEKKRAQWLAWMLRNELPPKKKPIRVPAIAARKDQSV